MCEKTNGIATENVKYTFTGSGIIPDSFDGKGNPVALPPVAGSAQVFSLVQDLFRTMVMQWCVD